MFNIKPTDAAPIWKQIEEGMRRMISLGALAAGDPVPSVRDLARDLRVNPNTVARAYRELETAGVVVKRRTAGTFVSDAGSPLARRERLKILTERLDALLAEARQLGVATDEVVRLLHERDAVLKPKET